jgi:hypothetical protein
MECGTDSECIEASLNAFRDLMPQFAPRSWGGFFLPVPYRDLETYQ